MVFFAVKMIRDETQCSWLAALGWSSRVLGALDPALTGVPGNRLAVVAQVGHAHSQGIGPQHASAKHGTSGHPAGVFPL